MRCWALYILSLFVVILASVQASAESTNNLLSQDFTDGSWSGTNLSSTHGSGTIAGVHNQYIESTITTDLYGLYLSEVSASVWFWNNESQSLQISQTIKDSNGKEYSNTTTVNGSCATFNGCGYEQTPINQIYITDSADTYDITARYSFTVPNQPYSHYGADLKDPSLILWYEPFSFEVQDTKEIDLWLDDFDKKFSTEFADEDLYFRDVFKDEDIKLNDYYLFENDVYIYMEDSKEEDVLIEEEKEIMTDDVEEFIEELEEENNENLEGNNIETPNEIKEKKNQEVKAFVSIAKQDSVNISVMVKDQPVLQDVAFYEPIILYANQLSLSDNRDIYNGVIYVVDDPLTTQFDFNQKNQEQQYNLQKKLETMQWKN